MKKFQVLLGLGILVMALWAVSAPIRADGQSLVGGWVWVNCNTPCLGNVDVYCDIDEAPPAICTNHKLVNVCRVWFGPDPTGTCKGTDTYPCKGNPACNSAEDTDCAG